MKYWLMKSEPFKYSCDDLLRDKQEHWDGVRNYQASNNMKEMKIGDLAFFYHSNEGLEIVGIAKIVKEYYPDHTDPKGRFGMVDISPVEALMKPVTLKAIKANPDLQDMQLIKQGRLSVSSVTKAEWDEIMAMSKA